ncbi:unnamed protein product [Leuciscus chuanchicus]
MIYDVEGCVPIWDSSHCRTGDLRTWAELSMVESLGLDLGLCPVAEAPGFAYGHTQANLDELKSINNIRRLMGNPYCISVNEKCRDIVMTPETTLALGAA